MKCENFRRIICLKKRKLYVVIKTMLPEQTNSKEKLLNVRSGEVSASP